MSKNIIYIILAVIIIALAFYSGDTKLKYDNLDKEYRERVKERNDSIAVLNDSIEKDYILINFFVDTLNKITYENFATHYDTMSIDYAIDFWTDKIPETGH